MELTLTSDRSLSTLKSPFSLTVTFLYTTVALWELSILITGLSIKSSLLSRSMGEDHLLLSYLERYSLLSPAFLDTHTAAVSPVVKL